MCNLTCPIKDAYFPKREREGKSGIVKAAKETDPTTNKLGEDLSTRLGSPFTNLPGATSPYTNPISGAQQFFRLISN
jgi:hypothetical protein